MKSDKETNLDRFATLPLDLLVEIDSLKLTVRELLALGPGDVLRTRKPAEEPLALIAGGIEVARVEPIKDGPAPAVRIRQVATGEGQ